jgi:hypothetical protein
MEFLGDVAHVISLLVHSETVLVSEQDRCMVCPKRTIGLEIILHTHNGLLGDDAHVEAHYDPLDIVLILMQDWCIAYAERTIGLEIILDTHDGTPMRCGSCQISFRSI